MSVFLYLYGALVFVVGGFLLLASFGKMSLDGVTFAAIFVGGFSVGVVILGIGRVIALLEEIVGNTKRSEGPN